MSVPALLLVRPALPVALRQAQLILIDEDH
jgi:hypothetical protein